MAVDRVAENGKGANQTLAAESTLIDRSTQACRYRQTMPAHRTRLRRIEAGTWPGTIRRPELARISPSCDPVHRRLRVPGTGTMPFPLRRLAATQGNQNPNSRTPHAIQLRARGVSRTYRTE